MIKRSETSIYWCALP